MILEEFLETSDARFFYIGAMGGSGFFAMGSKEDIKDEIRYQNRMEALAAEKRMSKANVDSREAAEAMAKIYKGRWNSIDAEMKSLRRQMLSTRSTQEKKEIDISLGKIKVEETDQKGNTKEKEKKFYI